MGVISSEPQHDPENRDAEHRSPKAMFSAAPNVVMATGREGESFVDAFARMEEARRMVVLWRVGGG